MQIKNESDLIHAIEKAMDEQGLNKYTLSLKVWGLIKNQVGRYLRGKGKVSIHTKTAFEILQSLGIELHTGAPQIDVEKLSTLAEGYYEEMVQELIKQGEKFTQSVRAEFMGKSVKMAYSELGKEGFKS